jgi:hypothetical protein
VTATASGLLVNRIMKVLFMVQLVRLLGNCFRCPRPDRLADLLVTTAAHLLPRVYRERYRMEWLAELSAFPSSDDGARLKMAADIFKRSPHVGWALRYSEIVSGSHRSPISSVKRFTRRIAEGPRTNVIVACLVGLGMAVAALTTGVATKSILEPQVHLKFVGTSPRTGHISRPSHVRHAIGASDGNTSSWTHWSRTSSTRQHGAVRWVSAGKDSTLVARWDRPIRLSAIGMISRSSEDSRSRETAQRISAVRYSFSDGEVVVAGFEENSSAYQWTSINTETTSISIEILSTRGVPKQGITIIPKLRFTGPTDPLSR